MLGYDIDGETIRAVRRVTEQKGSWRWQDAYRTAWYVVAPRRRRRPGQSALIWKAVAWSEKYARTRGRGDGLAGGSLNNRPVTVQQMRELAVLEEMTGKAIGLEE